jgi:hypothetical protein
MVGSGGIPVCLLIDVGKIKQTFGADRSSPSRIFTVGEVGLAV